MQARGSSIGGDSDGPTTLGSASGADEPSQSDPTRLDPPALSMEQLRLNEEALHDAQVEMEADDLVSVGSVAQPLGSPMRGTAAVNSFMQVPDSRVGLHDFELLSVVGQGAFGKVKLHSTVF